MKTFHEWRCVRCQHTLLAPKADTPGALLRRVYGCPKCKTPGRIAAPMQGTGRSEQRLVLPRRRRRDLL